MAVPSSPARRRPAPRLGFAAAGWVVAIGGVLLFGLHPALAIGALVLGASPTLFGGD